MKRWFYAVPVIGFVVLAFFLFHSLFCGPPDVLPSALIDKPAPAIGLAAIDEQTPGFSRADLARVMSRWSISSPAGACPAGWKARN